MAAAGPPAAKRGRLRWLVPTLVVLMLAGAGIGLWQHRQSQQRQQQAQRQQPLPRRIAALGRVEPLDRVVKLSVPASLSNDTIAQLLVKQGDAVTKDQVLAILASQESLQRDVRSATAAVEVARRKLKAQDSVIARYRGELAQAQVELRRYSQLYALGASSAETRDRRLTIENTTRANLDQALQDRETLKAELEGQEAALARNRTELGKATIRAPFAGTVFRINAYPGDKVGDDGILEMGDSSRMGVIAEVYQTDRPGITLVVEIARQVSRQSVFSGEAGENLDRRVIEVKIGLPPEAAAVASAINYLQVNVLFDPLTPEQKRQQQQRLEQLIEQQRREQSGWSRPSAR